MPDMQKLLQTKERILEVIRQRGPELPVRVANTIGGNNLFTAAFMSELVGEQKLKLSHMRVGSSPLYYIIGQEEQLQKYTDYLNHKEKEAFRYLKENKILEDEKLEPAIRVALRNIKDFAVPIQITNNGEIKNFWKIHTLPNNEAKEIIEKIISPKIENQKIDASQNPALLSLDDRQKIEENSAAQKVEVREKPLKIEKKIVEEIFDKPKEIEVKTQAPKEISSAFLSNIKSILESRQFKVLSEILIKKKEYAAKITTNTHMGKQEFYLVAKDKKKITIDDFVNTLQKSQTEKMPAIIMSTGEVDKKAQDYYKEWRNLIKHEKIGA